MSENYSDTLHNIAEYTLWAENKIIAVLRELEDDKFERLTASPNPNESRNLRQVVIHMLEGHIGYFTGFSNTKFTDRMKELQQASKSEVLDAWQEEVEKFSAFMKEATKDEYSMTSQGSNYTISPLDHFMMWTDHQTYHRGQVVLRLKDFGIQAPTTDYYNFLDEYWLHKDE